MLNIAKKKEVGLKCTGLSRLSINAHTAVHRLWMDGEWAIKVLLKWWWCHFRWVSLERQWRERMIRWQTNLYRTDRQRKCMQHCSFFYCVTSNRKMMAWIPHICNYNAALTISDCCAICWCVIGHSTCRGLSAGVCEDAPYTYFCFSNSFLYTTTC